tara:strand:+ start:420 stop:1703 length:1284 start_codon:yes stop_codon:yes gene_type:complete
VIKRLKALYKKKFIRDISWMLSANILIKPFQIVKSYFVARYLGPEQYGILKSVELIQMLNKFGDLGFVNTAIRDSGELIGSKNKEKLEQVKSVCYSSEIVLVFILFTIALLSNFLFEELIVRYAIILSSIALFSLKIFNIFSAEAIIGKNFKLLSKITIFQGFFNSVIIIITVPFFNLYAVLTVPIFSTLISCYYIYLRLNFRFSFKIEKSLFKNILSTSVKLTSGTLAFGLFRYIERIIVITYLGVEAVGFFGFADTILAIFITLFLTNIKVRKMNILEYLGQKDYLRVHKIVIKETAILVFFSLIIIFLAQLFLEILIPVYLPKWIDGILIAQLFLLVLPLKVLNSYIAVVIKSPTINKLLYSPLLHLSGVTILITGILCLNYFDSLSLKNFIFLDIIAYAIVHLPWLFIYYKEYYLIYISNENE